MDMNEIGRRAKEASYQLAGLTARQRQDLLLTLADRLQAARGEIMQHNALDLEEGRANGLSEALLDRLMLNEERIDGIVADLRQVAALADPIGTVMDGASLTSGLQIRRQRVPLGVVGVIYEARPNVTIDVASLCLKTANAVILRGGKESRRANEFLVGLIRQCLTELALNPDAVQLIANYDRSYSQQLVQCDRWIDMIIPRGGAGLQDFCRRHSTIPVIYGGIGVCHIFVEESATLAAALEVVHNAKCQRPSTCNALETLLVHRPIAREFLSALARRHGGEITFHGSDEVLEIMRPLAPRVVPLREEQLSREWGSKDLNVLIVDDLAAALAHIRRYGSGHSEAILTNDVALAQQFQQRVDAAAVYVNASTRFTDGAQFGLGAEVAVSTQKLHARGPMGLEALTTYKWLGQGDYSLRS